MNSKPLSMLRRFLPIRTCLFILFTLFLTSTVRGQNQLLESGGRIWVPSYQREFCDSQIAARFNSLDIHDASTGTFLGSPFPPIAFGQANGKIVQGFAFDPIRREAWFSILLSSSNCAARRGDGFIHRRAAYGSGTITTLPDPGGPNGPGIGALDYDPEEDVLWAAVYRPVNGQSIFYKINPNNGEVLKTISIPAALDDDDRARGDSDSRK